ncbi:hypothetical protein SACC_16140 [Saccharolobus caldissimus]|uniref:Transposase IS4-like domain-containing protein n=1 Tax=Saccharolobus caldissimus TaxID=1702097 RepID=A0AAQ4CS16_9CREN|nr:hypothetical protein SACC_16140 [Saccharolobus caldissimus]
MGQSLEVIADATGICTNKGRQYITAKWGEDQHSKFLKMDNNEFNVVNAEVTSNEVETAVKTVKDLQDKGKKVKKFYGDKAYDANEAGAFSNKPFGHISSIVLAKIATWVLSTHVAIRGRELQSLWLIRPIIIPNTPNNPCQLPSQGSV